MSDKKEIGNPDAVGTLHPKGALFLRQTIGNAVYMIFAIEQLIAPFLPATAAKIGEQFLFKKGQVFIKKGAGLFPRL